MPNGDSDGVSMEWRVADRFTYRVVRTLDPDFQWARIGPARERSKAPTSDRPT